MKRCVIDVKPVRHTLLPGIRDSKNFFLILENVLDSFISRKDKKGCKANKSHFITNWRWRYEEPPNKEFLDGYYIGVEEYARGRTSYDLWLGLNYGRMNGVYCCFAPKLTKMIEKKKLKACKKKEVELYRDETGNIFDGRYYLLFDFNANKFFMENRKTTPSQKAQEQHKMLLDFLKKIVSIYKLLVDGRNGKRK